MKYYVVINGESSLNIQGLAIQSLPAISKPLMRSKRTEIDGRDGDIITKLGYSAYDKTLKIGLWGNYDINEVIAFFNQEGTITFSNEPDKYYNFTILNREDYINQLEAFREASITIHCQPYKYELNEQPVEIENEYVEQEGTSAAFTNTLEAPMEIDLKGNTSQNGTPTPSSPIPVNNVSGDNEINVCGKNLFTLQNITNGTYFGIERTINNSILTLNGTSTGSGQVIGRQTTGIVLPSGDYIVSIRKSNGTITKKGKITAFYLRKPSGQLLEEFSFDEFSNNSLISKTLTLIETTELYVEIYCNGAGYVMDNLTLQFQIEQGSSASTYEAYNGTTYNIDLPVENLFDGLFQQGSLDLGSSGGEQTSTIRIRTGYIPVLPNTTYTISNHNENLTHVGIGLYKSDNSYDSTHKIYNGGWNEFPKTFTTQSDTAYIRCSFRKGDGNTITPTGDYKVQLELGTKSNSYTPYGTTPIELNKIGTYQDYIYKENDKWYLHKEIGVEVFNGTESWQDWSTTSTGRRFALDKSSVIKPPPNNETNADILSNYYVVKTGTQTYNSNVGISVMSTGYIAIYDGINSTLNNFKNWLGTHNVNVNYALQTPTNTEITYTPLINQLNTIEQAQSKKGTTNITQINNDLPFIITASVLSGTDSITLTNEGNTTSKPIMTIYGKGTIGVYLSDSQIFNINLGDEEYITLDTANMEAYKVGVLKNRLVSGDYNSFKLETGNNTISFTGNVEKVEIQNYSRWI